MSGRTYEASYQAFLDMPEREWLDLLASLLRGGVLEPEEQRAYLDASKERSRRREAESCSECGAFGRVSSLDEDDYPVWGPCPKCGDA